MKKILFSSAFVATFALLAACGDDSSSGPAEESSSSIEAEEESSSGEGTPESSAMSSSAEIEEPESSSSNVIASSSSAKQSSSSSEESSSSVVFPEGVMSAGYYKDNCPSGHTCTDAAPSTYLKSGITYGEILDTRDDQVYKVVTIGDQVWMAQNLNYDPGNVSSMGESAWSGCYGEDGYDYASGSYLTDAQVAENCSKYGRLYTWAAAIDSVALANDAVNPQTCGDGKTCTLPSTVQGVCPEGWHLPSHSEWQTLFDYVGTSTTAGMALKSTSGWNDDGNGDDAYGFSALPVGGSYYDGNFYTAGLIANFWSSSEYDSYKAYFMYLSYDGEDDLYYYDLKYLAFSVRCIKD